MFDALLDFANMKSEDRTIDGMFRLIREHEYFHSLAGQKRGFESTFTTRQKPEIEFVLLDDLPGEVHEFNHYVFPGDPRMEEMGPLLQKSQAEYVEFLDSVIDNQAVDARWLNDRLQKSLKQSSDGLAIGKAGIVFRDSKDPFHPLPEIFLNWENIEEFIDVTCIFYPLWRHEGQEFARIKRCEKCGNFLYAKHAKRKFCSDKCRLAAHYQNK